MTGRADIPLNLIRDIANAILNAGGRAFVVGGYVRDQLLGIDSKDIDVEIYHLSVIELEQILRTFGEVLHVGKAFGVLRIKDVDVDFSLPRQDLKVQPGHKGFQVSCDPTMSFEDASRRRDVTINSMGLDPITGNLLDPHGGRLDLKAKILRATDPIHFGEDPLRALRVASFAARFRMTPNQELSKLCAVLNLSELSAERIFEEINKLLLKSDHPSIGFDFLRTTGLLRFFPEVETLINVPQEPKWHPEGDVFVHTMMALDQAAKLRRCDDDDLALMYGTLCHDFGKPMTTEIINGRIRSREHDKKGVPVTEAFLNRLRAPKSLVRKVSTLVRHHLAPTLYYRTQATPKAYRQLVRELAAKKVSPNLLLRVARADHLGRTTDDAMAQRFPAWEHFQKTVESLSLEQKAPSDVVLGRHLIARDLKPGQHFTRILTQCREVQDETGWNDPEKILDRVLHMKDADS